ncbi:FAD-dependent oxidoreductase, partial [Mesorhizobium sp. M1E.F.Ca.ET.041.01.1.1]|uniref:FAD-dependent oxidoreductase n=1 Tax=Mesorhizobium sp. M1E.F.Ca.ET.041.01.1.1 TaxID=2496759 RepID=UPI000FD29230
DENARQIDVAGLAPDFSFGLFPDAWDQLNPYVEKIIEKLPIFGTAEIKNFINGPESFTPDHRYLLGESRAVPGFYTLAGMNSGGIGASLGAGRQLAELIINGSPTEDLSSVDVNRFQAFEGSEEWVRLSGPDLTSSGYYFTNPVVAYPARNVRLSPVHQLLDAQEASFEPICGWEVAAYFGSSGPEPVRSECQKLDCAAGLSDQSYYGKIRVVGYGAGKTLGLLASQQTSEAIAAGRAVFANERGGIEGIATIIPLGIDDNLIVVEPEATAHLLGFLKSKAPDLRVAEETSAWALFVVAGQAAAEAVKALHIALTTSAQGFVGYVPVTVVEHAADFSMLTPTEYAVGLYKSILARAGAAVAEFGPVGSTAMERRRVAHGVARWGRDVNPYRAADILGTERGALERVISFSTVDASAETPQVYAPIWSGGMCVGHVTSVAPYNDRIAIIGRVFGSLSEDEIVVDTGNDLIPLTLHYSRT